MYIVKIVVKFFPSDQGPRVVSSHFGYDAEYSLLGIEPRRMQFKNAVRFQC